MPDTTYRHELLPDLEIRHPWDWEYDQWAFSPTDWAAMLDYIAKQDLKTVMEFGSGLSSTLLSQVAEVVTLENSPAIARKVRRLALPGSKLTVVDWDGRVFPEEYRRKYDLAFIDGPWFPVPDHKRDRESAFKAVLGLADRVFVHDALRDGEMRLQLWYLAPHYHVKGMIHSDDNRNMLLWEK